MVCKGSKNIFQIFPMAESEFPMAEFLKASHGI